MDSSSELESIWFWSSSIIWYGAIMRNKIYMAIVILLCSNLSAQQHPHILINEFLASNVTIDADIYDFDDYSDWIELYNAENVAVDISGFFLTDDLDNPSRWKIPSGTIIKAKSFIRFWADGYNDVPGKTYRRSYYPFYPFTTKYYHLSFKLSRAGETIGLFDPIGKMMDSVRFDYQLPDVSMGRQPDGSPNWVYFGEPTPVAANIATGTIHTEFAENPDISLQSGFYTGIQIVSITVNANDAEIRYTLDGSRPNSTSELYTSPLQISQTTVLRVRVFQPDRLPSQMITRTYFIDENFSLPVVSISFFPDTFWDDTLGIYDKNFKEREVPIHFEFFPVDGSPGFNLNAGLQLTGQASLYYPQKSFTINTDDRFGADVINYQIFPQRQLNEFKALYLRNSGVPDHRSTFFRDALQHTIVLNKIDIDCQAYLPAVVFLNGAYWGILNIRDKINNDYLASLHQVNPDAIDLLEYEGNPKPTIMSGNLENYLAFYKYIESADLSLEENYRFIETWMDIDEYVNYQICEIFYDNVFWLDQNVRMWRERKNGAKWRWILFDTDFGFGMPNQISKGVSNNTLRFAISSNPDTPGIPPQWATLIFRKLLSNDEFKIKFIQRFASYLNYVFQPDTVLAVVNQLQSRLNPEMPRHISRWRAGDYYYGYPIPDYLTWVSNVNVLKNFARNRPQYQRQHIIEYFNLTGTFKLDLVIDAPGMGIIQINGVERIDESRSRLYFKNIPTELKAIPSVGYRFVRWEGAANSDQNSIQISVGDDSVMITACFEPVSILTIPPHISWDTTLEQTVAPYYACGNVVVDSGATLRLKSGVKILMPEQASLIVHGRLLVEGSAEHPVIIAPNEYSSHWGALCFVNAADSSVISHLKIIGATKGVDFSRDRAAISGYNSRFSLQDVQFENVQAPVFVQYGNVSIKNCRFYTDVPGDLINVKFSSSPVIENCEFCGNEYFDSDAIDFDHISNGIIRGNRIYNIYGPNSDAIDLGEAVQNTLIENNIIYNVCDKGISIGGGSIATVRRNVIVNCGQGAGIKDFNSFGYFEHNTFYGNQYGIASFEKNIGHGGGNVEVVNCIIANSVLSSVYIDGLSRLDISYSLSNTDDLPGLSNIRAEPGFINNLHLTANSPAIDQGDPSLPDDPDGSRPDIGAYPFDPENPPELIITEIHYHPAEGTDHEFIEILNAGSSAVNLIGFRLDGDVTHIFTGAAIASGEYIIIAKNSSFYQIPGCQVIQWNTGTLPDGPGSILLMDAQGQLIDFVNYDRRCWWPQAADGNGPSLELISPILENMASRSWRNSYANGGTPGHANNSIPISGIFINEFLAGNRQVIADESGEYDDWIELYNGTGLPLNLGGLYLTDNLSIPCKYLIPTHSADATTIPAGGFLLFWADGQTDQGILHLSFKLDKEGEQIGLVQITDTDTVFIDSLMYGDQTTDVSFGRFPDGSETWQRFDVPTPWKSNQISYIKNVNQSLPATFALLQNYPNPFNPKTVISYTIGTGQLPVFSEVELSIYNLLGQKVAKLVSGKQPAGYYRVEWDASDFATGVYLYRLEAGTFSDTRKLILLK
jgi:hypothetical protein